MELLRLGHNVERDPDDRLEYGYLGCVSTNATRGTGRVPKLSGIPCPKVSTKLDLSLLLLAKYSVNVKLVSFAL